MSLQDLTPQEFIALLADVDSEKARRDIEQEAENERVANLANDAKEQLQRGASKQISQKLEQIKQLYNEASEIADEAGVGFSYNGPGGYGDSGYYTSLKELRDDYGKGEDWKPSDDEWGWQPSSGSC